MQLTLSTSQFVRNAVFTNESSQIMYKTTHPRNLIVRMGTTTLYKVKPNEDPSDMRDQFHAIGEIEWHTFGSSTFRLNGQVMQSDTFLPSHGTLGRKRTFTGPDGRPYRWDMVLDAVVLSRDEELRTEVARYHRDVEHMLDLIVLTFVYVEKLRMDKDEPPEATIVP